MKRLLVIFLLIFASWAVFAQSDLQPVAIVNLTKSEPITVKQLKTELESAIWPILVQRAGKVPTSAELGTAVQSMTPAQRRQALDTMINQKLVLQAAERDRITVTDNEINQQIAQMKAQLAQAAGRQPTDEQFAVAVKTDTGQDLPAFRETMKRQAITQKYLMSKKQNVFSSITQPGEGDIINFYTLNKTDFMRPDTVRYHTIMVPFGQDPAAKIKAKELIDRLSREIQFNPSRFDETVEKSRTPNSGYSAGDAGYIPRNGVAQQVAGADFINTAFSLKQGEVSKVIECPASFQIIKVTESLPMKALELDDIASPGSRVTLRQYISDGLLQERQQEAVARATQELITELRTGNPFRIMDNNLNW